MSLTMLLLAVATGLLVRLYLKMRKAFKYWEERGVDSVAPLPFLGSSLPLVTFSLNKGELYQRLYNENKGKPYFGMYEFTRPQLVIRDPELIGKVLVKDFNHFVDHGFEVNEETAWININLFNMKGGKWRAVRYKLAPTFTTGKLRGMHGQVIDSAGELVARLARSAGEDVDSADPMSRYSTEVIASVAFGLDSTRADPEFQRMGSKALDLGPAQYLGFLLGFNFPWLAKLFGVSFVRSDVGDYFGKIIRDTFEHRIKNKVTRNDFVQLLLQLKEKGHIEMQTRDSDDDYLKMDASPATESFELTDRVLIAQAFSFILAGFESMSNSLSFTFFELATHQEMQQRARREVLACYRKHGEKFTYDALKEMTYVDKFINETLRLHPLASFLFRTANKPYTLENGEVLDEGTMVVIPMLGIHKDPAYWPQPERFDPERFSDEAERTPHTFFPFGDGPRICIGMRFALLQIKQAVASVLKEFQVELSPRTRLPLTTKKATIILSSKDPIYLRFKKLED